MINLLVSFCNVRLHGLPLLGVLDTKAFECRVLEWPKGLPPVLGTTGLARFGDYLYVAVQIPQQVAASPSHAVLLIFDLARFTLLNVYCFRQGVDVHSLLAVDELLYAASTGTDEVLRLHLRGAEVISEEVYWRPDMKTSREDGHHLNALALVGSQVLVSGFGKKTATAWNTANTGFIRALPDGALVADRIEHPHTLLPLAGSLAYCESRRQEVRLVNDPRRQTLPGYTRGLAVVGDHLFAATSVGRRVSRSAGTVINNPGVQGEAEGRCTISRLAVADFRIEATLDLTAYAREIYDLLPIEDTTHWPLVDDLVWRDRALIQLSDALDHETANARNLARTFESQTRRLRELENKSTKR